nr:hypothetical protein 1A9.150 [imported] - Neurospora crassa [Neurospora crassa]
MTPELGYAWHTHTAQRDRKTYNACVRRVRQRDPGVVKIPVMFAGLMVQAEGLGEIERERGRGLSYRVRKPGGFTVVDKLMAYDCSTLPPSSRRQGRATASTQQKLWLFTSPVIDDQVGRAQAINRNTCTGSGETVENRWLSVGPAVWSPVHGLWISWSAGRWFINSMSIVMTFGNPQM